MKMTASQTPPAAVQGRQRDYNGKICPSQSKAAENSKSDLVRGVGVQAGGGLIKEEHSGVGDKRNADVDTLALPACHAQTAQLAPNFRTDKTISWTITLLHTAAEIGKELSLTWLQAEPLTVTRES